MIRSTSAGPCAPPRPAHSANRWRPGSRTAPTPGTAPTDRRNASSSQVTGEQYRHGHDTTRPSAAVAPPDRRVDNYPEELAGGLSSWREVTISVVFGWP